MNRPRGSRGLDAEDRALWEEVKKSVEPLRRHRPEPKEVKAESPALRDKPVKALRPASDAPAPKREPPLAPFDRRFRQRLARGSIEIDARLDLHGLTLERARARLASFLASAQAQGVGLALVITGKGAGRAAKSTEDGRGALRREVPHWLSLPDFRPFVIGFEEAGPAHGGAGALYVRVRRKRQRI